MEQPTVLERAALGKGYGKASEADPNPGAQRTLPSLYKKNEIKNERA